MGFRKGPLVKELSLLVREFVVGGTVVGSCINRNEAYNKDDSRNGGSKVSLGVEVVNKYPLCHRHCSRTT